jgi:hypothetical protein
MVFGRCTNRRPYESPQDLVVGAQPAPLGERAMAIAHLTATRTGGLLLPPRTSR